MGKRNLIGGNMAKKTRIEVQTNEDQTALIDQAAALASLPRATWVKQQMVLSAIKAIRAAGGLQGGSGGVIAHSSPSIGGWGGVKHD